MKSPSSTTTYYSAANKQPVILFPLLAMAAVFGLLQYQMADTRSLTSASATADCHEVPVAAAPVATPEATELTTTTTTEVAKSSSSVHDSDSRKPKLADGCHHVFLDVGANIGVHARFLFEPDQYPQATMARGWFDDAFGVDRDPRDICVFSFEPNPKHKERLEGLAQAYAAMGWRYHPIFAGVSDAEGTLDFVPSRDALGRGFSARSGNGVRQKGTVTVPVQRLASWLLDEIEGRQLPDTVYGDYKGEAPKVVMKLDVETLEYVVLPDLLLSGALCNTVDKVFGEVHYQFFPLTFEKNGLTLSKAKEAKVYFMDQLRLMNISRHCKTTWITEDDETHSEDGVPFPKPSLS